MGWPRDASGLGLTLQKTLVSFPSAGVTVTTMLPSVMKKKNWCWIGEGKLNLLTLHNQHLGNFQGGREKEGQKWSAFDFPPLFEPFPSWDSAPDRIQSRKLDRKTENYQRSEGINFAVNSAKFTQNFTRVTKRRTGILTTAFRSWKFLLLLLFQLPL